MLLKKTSVGEDTARRPRMTVTEAEAVILWLPDAKSQFIEKGPDAGKD